MLGARLKGGDRRRPMLLALVFGVVLVLVGVTASALVAVASDHLANATLGGVVNRDATLVELFVNGELRADDLTSDGPGGARVDEIAGRLERSHRARRDRSDRDPRPRRHRPPQRRAGDRRDGCGRGRRHACRRRRRTDGRAPGVGSRARGRRGAAEPIGDGAGVPPDQRRRWRRDRGRRDVARRRRPHGAPRRHSPRHHARDARRGGDPRGDPLPRLPRGTGKAHAAAPPAPRRDAPRRAHRDAEPRRGRRPPRRGDRARAVVEASGSAWRSWTSTTSGSSTTRMATPRPTRSC